MRQIVILVSERISWVRIPFFTPNNDYQSCNERPQKLGFIVTQKVTLIDILEVNYGVGWLPTPTYADIYW